LKELKSGLWQILRLDLLPLVMTVNDVVTLRKPTVIKIHLHSKKWENLVFKPFRIPSYPNVDLLSYKS